METYGELPLSFEANQGQTDAEVTFLSHGPGYTLFLTPTEAVLLFRKTYSEGEAEGTSILGEIEPPNPDTPVQTWVRMQLVGANPDPQVTGLEELPGKSHYFIGSDPSKWRTRIPTYAKVNCKGVYPGVDLLYYGKQGQLEYDFVVAPGADPKVIRLAFLGVDKLEVDPQGDLVLYTGGGQIRQHKPRIFQDVDGTRLEISGRYLIGDQHQVDIQVGAYDPARPLVIDPVLAFSTYLGGGGDDFGWGIALDEEGNAYVTGTTRSPDFPTSNALQPTLAGPEGSEDAFVTKLNPDGSALIYSTYLGGSDTDTGGDIAADSDGNVYVTGQSRSPDFPLANPFQPDWSGHSDAFVAKLNSTGSSLVYSTYLGGQQYDFGSAIAVDSPGSAYVTGFTRSADFPTANPLDSELSGTGNAGDAFVTKLTPAGSGLVYSTYLGGEGEDIGYGIAVDQEGNAFITGRTSSVDFPTANAFQPTHRGGMRYMLDAFVTKIDATGFGLVYSTYLGGPAGDGADGSDIGSAIAVDPEGNAYVTGKTSSPDFPTSNALQSALRDIVALKSTDGGNSWSPIHTGLVNGYLHTLVVDPGTPSTLYAGTGTGVFKSTDGGSNWGRISPSNLHARAITIDPTNPSTLYAGTWKGGVFKSTDGGNSWNATALMSFIFDLVIDSTTPSTLYAGTERGVSKSTDGGSNWTSSSLSNIHALAIDPTDSSTLYAGTDRGVFKSTDAGDSWQATALMNFIFALVIDSTTPSTLYAGTTGGVFKSADRGNSWTPTPLTASIEALAIDPVTSSTLYAASQGSSDTFVAKFSAAGSLVYSTYLGGGGTDDARGISVDQEGNAYVTGATSSPDFPTVNSLQGASGLRRMLNRPVAGVGLVPIYRHAFVAKIHRTWLSMAKPKGPSPRQQKLGQAAELGSIASGSKLIGKPAPKLAAKLNKAVGSQELAKVDHLLKQSKALEQSLAIYKSLQGYRDTTTTERHLVSPSMDSRITTQMFFAFERPDRLRLETKDGPAGEWVMVSNGKDLVTYRGMWKQYTTEKTPREWQSAERRWMFSSRLDHLVQRLVLSKNPARELLEEVEEVVEKGRDDLEGTPAIIVELKMPAKSLGERWAAHKMIPVRLWIDERDFLIRKGSYDLDWETMSQKMPEEMRRRMPFKQMTLIMEFTDIELNPVFPEDTFRFSPPEDATLVEHFGPPDGRSPVSQGELVGRRAPNFVLKDIQGKKVGLDDFKGKVLIVDFWATWCSPCREQMPTYTALQSLYAPRGFSMIGLSVDDGPEVVRDFAENYRVNFPLLMADEQVRQQYGGTGVLPTTFVIDKGGIVRYEFKGPPPAKLLFQRRVEELLEERITIDREDATPRPEAGDASSVPENITSPGQPAVSHNQQASKTEIARFIQFRLVANAPSNQADEMTLIDDALRAHRVWLEKKVQLDLNDVKHAEVESRYEQPYSVRVVLTSEATKKFSQITGNNIGRSVAVVIDGELVMAPSITGQLNFKKVPIRFGLTLEEAQALAAKVNELVAGRSH